MKLEYQNKYITTNLQKLNVPRKQGKTFYYSTGVIYNKLAKHLMYQAKLSIIPQEWFKYLKKKNCSSTGITAAICSICVQ